MDYEHDEDETADGRLSDADASALVRRCSYRYGSDPRKKNANERWRIYTEDFKPLILRRVETVQSDKETREEISKHVDLTNNVGLDITRATSVCWRQGVRRSISDVTDKQLEAFRAIEIESKIDVHALAWNQIASLVGPIIVVPMIRSKQLSWDVLLPTYVDLVPDPEDPYGCPIAAAWSFRPYEAAARRARDAADTVVLDGYSWRYYSTFGGRVVLLEEIVHGLGYFPGEPLGFSVIHDGDWFGGCKRHQRLVDATVSIGTINAALSFVRKAQNKKLLSIIGDLEGLPKLQRLDPEIAVSMHADQNQRLDLETHDFDTGPERFIAHAEWILRQVADTYGGAVTDDGKGGRHVVFDDKALTEIRNEQLPFARAFERGLWAKAVEICRVLKHPLFHRLPSADDIRNGLQLDFGKLARSFADPAAEAAYIDWLISKGALDQVELTRRIEGSNLSDEQVWGLIDRRLENQAKFNDEVTKRNLGMNGSNIQSASQAFGALGPLAKKDPNGVTPPAVVTVAGEPSDAPAEGAEQAPTQGDAPAVPAAQAAPAEPVVTREPLNGAQVTSFLELASAVAEGRLPIELAEQFLPAAFPDAITEVDAKRLLAPLRGFIPRVSDVAPKTSKPAPDGASKPAPEGADDGERKREPG